MNEFGPNPNPPINDAYLKRLSPSSTAAGLSLYRSESQSLEYISLWIVLNFPEFLNTIVGIGASLLLPLLGYFTLSLEINLLLAISGLSLRIFWNSFGKLLMNIDLFS